MIGEPLVSVIIPAYNAAATIAVTIESVLNQTEANFEIIVVDDGSRDETAAIVSAIADHRIRLISTSNAGQASARNRGIKAARGEFIAFLDADDRWTTEKLSSQLAVLTNRPEAGVAYSWVTHVDSAGRCLRRGSEVTVSGWVNTALIVMNFLENGSNPLVRRSAIESVGLFDPTLVPSEDWDMWLRLADRFKFVAVPAVQILYLASQNSQSADTRRLERSCRACIAAWLARHTSCPQEASVGPKPAGDSSRAVASINGAMSPRRAQALASQSLGNVYKYLCYKELAVVERDLHPHRRVGRAAYLWLQACRYDPSLLTRRVALRVFLRLVAVAILPFVVREDRLVRCLDRPLVAIEPLLGYIR